MNLAKISTTNAILMLSGTLEVEPNLLVEIIKENNLRGQFTEFCLGNLSFTDLTELFEEVV